MLRRDRIRAADTANTELGSCLKPIEVGCFSLSRTPPFGRNNTDTTFTTPENHVTVPAPPDPAEGRPVTGPGSLGRLFPRAIALVIDWFLCSVIAMGTLGYTYAGSGGEGFKPLLVFVIENILLVSTIGTTVGHRLLGLAVIRPGRPNPGFLSGTVRTVLLALVIPAVITDRFGRGLHDKIAGTLIVSTR